MITKRLKSHTQSKGLKK